MHTFRGIDQYGNCKFIEDFGFEEVPICFYEFNNIPRILGSTMQTKLLLTLYRSRKKLATLRDDLEKPSSNIIQGLKVLRKNRLINKIDKYYCLSPTGYILTVNLLKLIEKWYFIELNVDFWINHNTTSIPPKFFKEIAIFKNAKYVVSNEIDLKKPLHDYLEQISSANSLKIILPIFSKVHLDAIVHKLDNDCNIEIIVDENIFESINNNGYKKKLFKDVKNKKRKNLKIWTAKEDLNLFLTVSENFLSLSLFFEDGSYDDSSILVDKSEEGINWGLNLFEFYKKTKISNETI